MEKNKSEFIKKFTKKFSEFIAKYKSPNRGYIAVAYDRGEDDSKEIQNAYVGGGSPVDLVECLYGCMQKDQNLANIIITASTAYMSSKAAELDSKNKESQKLS